MTISRKDALTIARDAMKETNAPVADVIQKMIDQLSKERKPLTEDQRQARNAKIREKTAAKRKVEMDKVLPVLRATFSRFQMPITAKELYLACVEDLPDHYTDRNVQYILAFDMKDEVNRVEVAKNKPYAYELKRV